MGYAVGRAATDSVTRSHRVKSRLTPGSAGRAGDRDAGSMPMTRRHCNGSCTPNAKKRRLTIC